jgi:hypothetical protein
VAYDYDADARALADELRRTGYPNWADQLTDVIVGGATGTEIMMGLRWTLDQLTGSEPAPPAALLRRVRRLRDAIDRAL